MSTSSLLLFLLSLTPSGDTSPVQPADCVGQPQEARAGENTQAFNLPEQEAELQLWGDHPLLQERVSRIC